MGEEYVSNSHKSKAEPVLLATDPVEAKAEPPKDRMEKVVKGNVKTRKKSALSKAAGEFVSEDARNVGDYIVRDVLLPAAKKAISDIVTDGIQMILYGSTQPKSKSNVSYVSYDRSYRSSDRFANSANRVRRCAYDFDDYIFESSSEADEVLSAMDDAIERYGMVSIADYCDLVGVSSQFTDGKYGWTNLRQASVQRVRDGWVIKLPRAMALE